MAKSATVYEILQRYSRDEKVTLKEAQAATAAATALRNEFLNDVFQAMQDPSVLDSGAFKCMFVAAKLLFKQGLISPQEMKALIDGAWMSLVPLGLMDGEQLVDFTVSLGMDR